MTTLSEALTKAADGAEFLVSELQAAHRELCADQTPTGLIAERAMLAHLADARKLQNALAIYLPAKQEGGQ